LSVGTRFQYKYKDLDEFKKLNLIGCYKGDEKGPKNMDWNAAGILRMVEVCSEDGNSIGYHYCLAVGKDSAGPKRIDVLGGQRDRQRINSKNPYDRTSKRTAAREYWEESGQLLDDSKNKEHTITSIEKGLDSYVFSQKGGYVFYTWCPSGNKQSISEINKELDRFCTDGDKTEMSELIYVEKKYLDQLISGITLEKSEMYLEIDISTENCIRSKKITNENKKITKIPVRPIACWLLWLNLELNK
jgi:hypothetical protein